VKISGVDREGNPFSEEAETVCVSKFGASLRTNRQYAMGQILTVQTLDQGHSGQFQVVWLSRPGTRQAGQIGIERIDAHRFWGIEFPPEDWGRS
jgi:hypothetical protein